MATRCCGCGYSGGNLLGCARCKKAWFCNRGCQAFARAELGHRGANCRAVDDPPPDAAALAQASAALHRATLIRTVGAMVNEANAHRRANTRIGRLAAVEKVKDAVAVTDLIDGAYGAELRSKAHQYLSRCLARSGDLAAAARAAASSLRAARASGNRTELVFALAGCGDVARLAPAEMVKVEAEGREQERRSLGVDLLLEGRVSLPTTARATRSMGLAYAQVALAVCDAALAAAGGRGSPAAADRRRVPSPLAELTARDAAVACLAALDEDPSRVMELTRQLVALSRQMVRTAAPSEVRAAQGMLAQQLSDLSVRLGTEAGDDAEACLRESLALCEGTGDVQLTTATLRQLVNLCNRVTHPDAAAAKVVEAEAFRSRLNQLLVQAGRSSETDCSICLEPLAQDAGAASGGVLVLRCNHQFHVGCTMAYYKTSPKIPCPMCKG